MGAAMVDFVTPIGHEPLERCGDTLRSADGRTWPVVDGIPRFVDGDSYAAGFGVEWNAHPVAQLDSASGLGESRSRLERVLGVPLAELAGKTVLEAGCGAGRFTELLVDAGALVHSVDLSSAVEANRRNIGQRPNYRIAQADIGNLPFPPRSFDVVLCLGVLQHTPDPDLSIRELWTMVAPGGTLAVDHYTWSLDQIKTDALLRPILKRLPAATSKRITDRLVRVLFPIHWRLRNNRIAAVLFSRVSPVYQYIRAFPELTRDQHQEWAMLDTYDALTDYYKRMRTVSQIRGQLDRVGAADVAVWKGGNGVEARCRKPA